MNTTNRLGVTVPELRRIAKMTGKDHELALALWRTGVADARILASMVDEPQAVTPEQMDAWVADFDSWDVCDQHESVRQDAACLAKSARMGMTG